MSGAMHWIVGAIAGLVGLVGLFLASEAETDAEPTYWIGLGMFVAAAAFDFWLIKHWFDSTKEPASPSVPDSGPTRMVSPSY